VVLDLKNNSTDDISNIKPIKTKKTALPHLHSFVISRLLSNFEISQINNIDINNIIGGGILFSKSDRLNFDIHPEKIPAVLAVLFHIPAQHQRL